MSLSIKDLKVKLEGIRSSLSNTTIDQGESLNFTFIQTELEIILKQIQAYSPETRHELLPILNDFSDEINLRLEQLKERLEIIRGDISAAQKHYYGIKAYHKVKML